MTPLVRAIALLLLMAVWGCGSRTTDSDVQYSRSVEPGEVEPHDEIERAILAELPKIDGGTERSIGGRNVVVGEAYAAASGRMCRKIAILADAGAKRRERLACRDHREWVLVPDVFAAQVGGS